MNYDNYQLLNTDEMLNLLNKNRKLVLPPVTLGDKYDDVLALDGNYGVISPDDNPIVSIEEVDPEEVQCIQLEDEDHLYITDDLIPTHNTSNIVFLKSTDDTLLETLEKMSGKTHRSVRNSKTVTKDIEKLAMKNDGKVSYTLSTEECPVISYNDLAFLSERNSIVFRAGDSPIWNRNEMILPMSWRLFMNTIEQPGKDYTLQTIPTLSTALDFDIRKNQPDFEKMLDKRLSQAVETEKALEMYKKAFKFSDLDLSRLDPDDYSDALMTIINMRARVEATTLKANEDKLAKIIGADPEFVKAKSDTENATKNEEQEIINKEQEVKRAVDNQKRYARGLLSRDDLKTSGKSLFVNAFLNNEIMWNSLGREDAVDGFMKREGDVLFHESLPNVPLVSVKTNDDDAEYLNAESRGVDSRVYNEGGDDNIAKGFSKNYIINDAFIDLLVSMDNWLDIKGDFDRYMSDYIKSSRNV